MLSRNLLVAISLFIREIYKSMILNSNIQVSRSCHSNIGFLCRSTTLLNVKNCDIFKTQLRLAGHAKWQNVKHVKAEKDRQKNLITSKYARLLKLAASEGGSDPKINSKLGDLIEQARKLNISSSLIENALKKGDNKKNKFGSIEVLGPGGTFVILEYETDSISEMRHQIKFLCKKYGANIMTGEGRWRAVYEQKGIIKVTSQKNGDPLDAEKALDSAIEAGAEEVQTKEDEEEKIILEFLCAPNDLHPVKKELEKQYDIEEGFVSYIPTVTVELDKENTNLLDNFLEELGNHSDIVRIYENAQ